MQWDDVNGPRSYFGKSPVNTDKPIEIGEIAKLRADRFEIKVKIIENNVADVMKGEVIELGSTYQSEIHALIVGDLIDFNTKNIVTLYRN